MNIKRQAGFGVVIILVVLVALTTIGFVGFKIYSNAHSAEAQANDGKATQQAKSNTAAKAPEITSAADLDKASAALDSIDADNDDGDTSQLNTQLNGL